LVLAGRGSGSTPSSLADAKSSYQAQAQRPEIHFKSQDEKAKNLAQKLA
jgi:hypothetical protein